MKTHLRKSILVFFIFEAFVGLKAQEVGTFKDPLSMIRDVGSSPAIQTDAAGSFSNPALGATMPPLSSQFDVWAFALSENIQQVDSWGLFYSDSFFSLGSFTYTAEDESSQTDLHLGMSFGNRTFSMGFANISVFNQDQRISDYFNALQWGMIYRPNRFLSLGSVFTGSYKRGCWNLFLDGGLRPFGTPAFTFFGAYSVSTPDSNLYTYDWQAGLVISPSKGIDVYGKYISSGAVSLGLAVRLGAVGLASTLSSTRIDMNSPKKIGTGISLMTNKEGYSIATTSKNSKYVELSLNGV
ncbi:MAG: hypothetical protein SNJ56_04290, partial [Termitinemataceae bacterium]